MKQVFYALAWILLSAGIILTSIATYDFFYITKNKQPSFLSFLFNSQPAEEITFDDNLMELTPSMEITAETEDARAEIVSNFLKRHKSPLEPYDYYGQKLVEIADKYGMDFRLLPAIAMKESGLCKAIPKDSYNCLGWGITSSGTLGFESYEDSFESAAKGLRTKYVDVGKISTVEIGKMYNPNTPAEWASGVDQFMSEMRHDDRVLGKQFKTEGNALEFVVEQ